MSVEVPGVPAGSVIITPNQMYVEMREMKTEIQHLAGVIDPALTTIREDISDVKASIAALKRGLVGVVAFVVTAVLGLVGAYIQSGRL